MHDFPPARPRPPYPADAEDARERVDEALVPSERHAHSRLAQPLRVLLTLVAERIEAGGRDVRGRDPGEVLAQQRRAAGIERVALVGEVVRSVPVELALGQVEAVAEVAVRGALAREVDPRIDEKLEDRPSLPRSVARDSGREVPAGAVSAHADPRRIDPELRGVLDRPPIRG
jgi:hypothetical protein